MTENRKKLQIIPLGGMGEVGKNMTVIRYNNEIMLIDSGLMFPEDEMLGIDIVIPDISYLIENRDLVKGIILTHGHEDHIGAMPYVLKEIKVPVYGTRLTLGLLQQKIKENNVTGANLITIKPRETIKLGNSFEVEPFRVSHSIPDAIGMAIKTPLGIILHTGDFKLDQTPVDGATTDFSRISQYGEKGVLVMLSDSTNVEKPGFTMSERAVGQTFDKTFGDAKERIIVATFASNVHRIQQVINSAYKYNKKVAIAGRSLVNVVSIAQDTGYLTIPENTFIELEDLPNYPRNQIVIITTGSQGEPMSALTRMAMSDHRKVEIVPGDTVIISATPIPGNEKLVARTINQLYRLGAEVLYGSVNGVHVSGHANQEELKMMLNLVRPKFFIPAHGEFRHLVEHAHLARKVGIPEENIFVVENGQIIEITKEKGCIAGKVTAGRVLIDGLGVGDVGNIVLRDRKQLSQDGILIVVVTINKEQNSIASGPDIVSRGFVYVREAEDLIDEARDSVKAVLEKCQEKKISDWATIKNQIRDALGKQLYEKTGRRPMIIPIIMEI